MARCFSTLGARVLSADQIAKERADADPGIRRTIIRTFGSDAYDRGGRLDRKRMAGMIFGDRMLRERLNEIIHPAVIATLRAMTAHYSQTPGDNLVFVEAAIIIDAGVRDVFDYLIVVEAKRETRIDRIMERDGISRADVLARMRAQLSPSAVRTDADFIIENNGRISALRPACRFLYGLLRTIAHQSF